MNIIADCQLPIANLCVTLATSWQLEIDNWQWYDPRYCVPVLTLALFERDITW